MLSLKIKSRGTTNKELEQTRTEGFVPGVYYGKKTSATPVAVPQSDFIKVWSEAGESSVVSLDSGENKIQSLIKDVQVDPVTDMPIHVDFYVFEKGQKLEVSIPLNFVGVAPAVKDLGGSLVKVLHELEIEAEPQNLPHEIEVDISSLSEFGSHISAKDIKLPEGVTLITDPEETIVIAEEPREEEPEEPTEKMDVSDVEVEKKGKEEESAESAESESK